MTTKIPELLFEIVECGNFCRLISSCQKEHPCSKVVYLQISENKDCENKYLLPEPWSGDIVNAPILVISSNPSYSCEELYPDSSWSETMIADFFMNRFEDRGEQYSWVYQNKVLNTNGSRSKSVAYWSNIKNRIEELIGREPVPGKDYCITEIVHCKSKGEQGVKEALKECSEKFFDKILSISGAKIIIAVGSKVREYLKGVKENNGIPIIYIPHPNSRRKKKLHDIYKNNEIEEYRKLLAKTISPKKVCYSNIQLPSEAEFRSFIDEQKRKFREVNKINSMFCYNVKKPNPA